MNLRFNVYRIFLIGLLISFRILNKFGYFIFCSSLREKNSEIVKQPVYSKIKLRKSPEEIEVFIPPKGFTPELIFLITFAIAWNSFITIWTWGAVLMAPLPINLFFGLFSIPFWAVGLSMIGAILFMLFGSTRLKITSKEISLTYECLKLKYQKPKPTSRHKIATIDRTKLSYDGQTKKDDSAVTIWADAKPYRIKSTSNSNANGMYVQSLSAIELDWLAQELSEWLNIPVTEK
ncbi:hypothetical protein IQ255_19785 [Pleurocapsales cyanobacterium LEGE 10410]|nr:hypothetical protein [Pleurocapsales cyanobacterium LEGE 10410]